MVGPFPRLRRSGAPIDAPAPRTCGAPTSSLYFAPDGRVLACCVNHGFPLGRIGDQSLQEIWEGARIGELRSAPGAGDYSRGCEDCGARAEAGNRQWSNAPQYDGFLDRAVPEFPSRMDFVLSNTCNLMCLTCNGYLSSAIRARREKLPPLRSPYGDGFFAELRPFLPHLEEAVFLGGEPFLAREPQRVWSMLLDEGLAPEVRVVSNGTQWNPRVQRYLTELPMSVAVSVDGATAATVEMLRVGADHAAITENVDRYERAVATHGGNVSYHYCLVVANWHELGPFLVEAEQRGRFVQVMTVTQPAEHSLFRLPAADLAAVVSQLERDDRTIRPQLDRLVGVWDAELDRLRRHLDQLSTGGEPRWVAPDHDLGPSLSASPVVLRSGRAGAASAGVAEALEADGHEVELARASGQPLLVLLGHDGVIDAVADVPPWAEALDPAGMVGLYLEQLHGAFCERLGSGPTPTVTRGADGRTFVSGPYERGRMQALCTEAVGTDGRQALRVAIAVVPAVRTDTP